MVNATRTGTFCNASTDNSIHEPGTGGSAQAGNHQEQPQGDISPPPPPPPENMTIAQFLQVLWEERQANFVAMQQMDQTLVNNQHQGRNGNAHSTLSEFMRNSPPTFNENAEPLDANEWIRTIEGLFALVNCNEHSEMVLYASHCLGGTARSWWDGFKVMQGDRVITWDDFKQGFRTAHVPSWIMDIKKREFRALKQGSSSIKEYLHKFNLLSSNAPQDVNSEAAEIERFMKGLQQALQYQLVLCDRRTFFDQVNKALMLEDKRHAMEETHKCKMINKGSSGNQKPRPSQQATAKPTYQAQQVNPPTHRPSYLPQ
ncbi:hypothetical protein D1007_42134 [Hordeum vulgare]|nr:hypothetical protein D1007_42134 [Hordeum vulgare]